MMVVRFPYTYLTYSLKGLICRAVRLVHISPSGLGVRGNLDTQWVQAHYCRTRGWVRGSEGQKTIPPVITASMVPGKPCNNYLKNSRKFYAEPNSYSYSYSYLCLNCIMNHFRV